MDEADNEEIGTKRPPEPRPATGPIPLPWSAPVAERHRTSTARDHLMTGARYRKATRVAVIKYSGTDFASDVEIAETAIPGTTNWIFWGDEDEAE